MPEQVRSSAARHPLDWIEPCSGSIESDLAALAEGFCPACHGRLQPHNRHVRCDACNRCMENLTRTWGEPVYSTWSNCAYTD